MIYLKRIALLAAALFVVSCGGAAPEVSTTPETNTTDQSSRVADTVASHSVEKEREKSDASRVEEAGQDGSKKRKWSRSGNPIDTSKFDAAIETAEKALKSKSGDASLKKNLGTAYFERGVALTDASQYASAIGDFRQALKYDPSNTDAKKQMEMISSIYDSINMESPKPGEEPAPLEFKKEKD